MPELEDPAEWSHWTVPASLGLLFVVVLMVLVQAIGCALEARFSPKAKNEYKREMEMKSKRDSAKTK